MFTKELATKLREHQRTIGRKMVKTTLRKKTLENDIKNIAGPKWI